MSALEFGVFDWIDRASGPLHQLYEDRLKLLEAADAAGFFCYHLLPLYDPLRLIEEVAMLDQLSGGPARTRHRPRRLALRAAQFRRRSGGFAGDVR